MPASFLAASSSLARAATRLSRCGRWLLRRCATSVLPKDIRLSHSFSFCVRTFKGHAEKSYVMTAVPSGDGLLMASGSNDHVRFEFLVSQPSPLTQRETELVDLGYENWRRQAGTKRTFHGCRSCRFCACSSVSVHMRVGRHICESCRVDSYEPSMLSILVDYSDHQRCIPRDRG